jgi:hypothetical protein
LKKLKKLQAKKYLENLFSFILLIPVPIVQMKNQLKNVAQHPFLPENI